MRLSEGFKLSGNRNSKTHMLKLLKNIYGLKQVGRVWNQHFHSGLSKLGYQQSDIDPCSYYKGKLLLAVYIDDCIMASEEKEELYQVIKELADTFEITDEGELDKYLGVKIERREDGSVKMYQPYLITQILKAIGFHEKTKEKNMPAIARKILHRDIEGEYLKTECEYARVIGQLNFREKSTRPDIACAVHQCARFTKDLRESHKKAILRRGRYLLKTRNEGIIYKRLKLTQAS